MFKNIWNEFRATQQSLDEKKKTEAADDDTVRMMRDNPKMQKTGGPGGMKEVANGMGIDWYGVDGDITVIQNTDYSLVHDFTLGEAKIDKTFDLIWCTEFLEHVEEKYVPNYMPLFELGKIAVVTAAPPGWPGHHHVNCREESYWIDVFKNYGLRYNEELTNEFKTASKMNEYKFGDRKNFFKRAGMVFLK